MLHNILNLFSKTPREPLKTHLVLVSECVERIPKLMEAAEQRDSSLLLRLKEEISQYEEQAEKIKSLLRSDLLGSMYLSIPRSVILEIVVLQDKLANAAKDIAFLCTVRPFLASEHILKPLKIVLHANIEAFDLVKTLLMNLSTLMEASFTGVEAEKAILMIEQIASKEREADILQADLLKSLLDIDTTLSPGQFYIMNSIFKCLASISNISERLALAVRAMIAARI